LINLNPEKKKFLCVNKLQRILLDVPEIAKAEYDKLVETLDENETKYLLLR
jgi:hypothetical protein